ERQLRRLAELLLRDRFGSGERRVPQARARAELHRDVEIDVGRALDPALGIRRASERRRELADLERQVGRVLRARIGRRGRGAGVGGGGRGWGVQGGDCGEHVWRTPRRGPTSACRYPSFRYSSCTCATARSYVSGESTLSGSRSIGRGREPVAPPIVLSTPA